MAESFRPLALVTGTSSGIGLELAKCSALALVTRAGSLAEANRKQAEPGSGSGR